MTQTYYIERRALCKTNKYNDVTIKRNETKLGEDEKKKTTQNKFWSQHKKRFFFSFRIT